MTILHQRGRGIFSAATGHAAADGVKACGEMGHARTRRFAEEDSMNLQAIAELEDSCPGLEPDFVEKRGRQYAAGRSARSCGRLDLRD